MATTCGRCAGTGKEWALCTRCNGKGCNTCLGGQTVKVCTMCGGTGRI